MKVARLPNLLAELGTKNRDSRGLVQVQASKERYFGEELRKHSQLGVNSMAMSQSQHFSMELYESRVASLQRFVAMTVMFHQMGMRVQSFFPKISFGLLGYRMDRTHSIMRIATTASPVSGADVRERMEELRLVLKIERSVQLIARTWRKWKKQPSHGNKPVNNHTSPHDLSSDLQQYDISSVEDSLIVDNLVGKGTDKIPTDLLKTVVTANTYKPI